jgi:hypothetical protein
MNENHYAIQLCFIPQYKKNMSKQEISVRRLVWQGVTAAFDVLFSGYAPAVIECAFLLYLIVENLYYESLILYCEYKFIMPN